MSTAVLSRPAVGRNVSTSHLKLTRRGRAVITGLIAIPFAVAGALLVGQTAVAGSAATPVSDGSRFEYVQVESGQSLWELAATIAPEADPREVVSDLLHLNQLGSGDVQPGQQLAVPEQYSH